MLNIIKHYTMKIYGRVDSLIHVFLTSALDGDEWSASRPDPFTSVERAHRTHWIGRWVGPKATLDNVKKKNVDKEVNKQYIHY
jgi:hypothetical protein